MASATLPAQYLKAGEDYLAALIKLGLHPEFLGWGRQIESERWMLVMVTAVLEISGPLALNELLFKAYNMNATPKEISPFIVRVYGSRTLAAKPLKDLYSFEPGKTFIHNVDEFDRKVGEGTPVESMGHNFADFHIESTDIYKVPPRRNAGFEQRTRDWMRFKSNVEKLAA